MAARTKTSLYSPVDYSEPTSVAVDLERERAGRAAVLALRDALAALAHACVPPENDNAHAENKGGV
jgi:hypothetical protein